MEKKKLGILLSLSATFFLISSSNIYADTLEKTDEATENVQQQSLKNEQSLKEQDENVAFETSQENDDLASSEDDEPVQEENIDTDNNLGNKEEASTEEVSTEQEEVSTEEVSTEQEEVSTEEVSTEQEEVSTEEVSTEQEEASTEEVSTEQEEASMKEVSTEQEEASTEEVSTEQEEASTEEAPTEQGEVISEEENDATKIKDQEAIQNTTRKQQSPVQSSSATESKEAEQEESNEHRYPILTIGANNTEKNLTWYHESEEQGYVEIAEANDKNDFSNATRIAGQTIQGSNTKLFLNKDVPDLNYTQVTLSNLQENTEYIYRFFNGEAGPKSTTRRFDTHNNGETNFITVGDPQLGSSGDLEKDNASWQNTVNQMEKLNKHPDFLLSLGDQVNKPWNEKEYSGFIEAQGMENFTVVPTLGNHDRANKAFSEHFKLPNVQEDGKNLAGSNFYYTHNDTLFISLNSESLDFKGHERTIQRAIEETKHLNPKWIVGLTHRNPYSAGKHSGTLATKNRRNHIAPLMEKYNVDVVLGGHDHSYSRSHVMKGKEPQIEWDENGEAPKTYTNPDGTVYVTLNSSSGSKYYELDGEKEYAAKSIQENRPTFSKVNITKEYFEILTYNVPQGSETLGEPIDSVRINKK